MNLKKFIVFFCLATLLLSSCGEAPTNPGPTPSPAGQLPPGLSEQEFERIFPQDLDFQLNECWSSVSEGRMGAPSEAEWIAISDCVATSVPGSSLEKVESSGNLDTAKYELMAAVPMVGLTLVDPIPLDEFVTIGYLVYQGVKFAIIALSVTGSAYLSANGILWLASRHSDDQHSITHTTARTYANIVRANLTGPNGPQPDVKCAIVLMASGAIRYAVAVPTHVFSGRAILAWWEGSSWGGAYRIPFKDFPETLNQGVKIIEQIACSKLPPPPGVLTP